MKKILSLAVLASLLGTAAVQAQTDIYIDGSTAFRANAYRAMRSLYSSGPTINAITNDVNNNPVWTGSSTDAETNASVWTMSGQMSTLFGSRTITVHAAFNGSVQGVHSVYANTDTQNYLTSATPGQTNIAAHTASCFFSDVDSSSTAYPLTTGASELYCAIQPFCWVRSLQSPSTFTNITFQQIQAIAPNGQVALSYLTGNAADTSLITLVNRSLDSGTRVTAFADSLYNGSVQNYYWNTTNNSFYASNLPLGPGIFGPGYVGGGDVVKAVTYANANNVAIAYLGLSDAKKVNGGLNILSYNGAYPSSDIKTGSTVPSAPTFDRCINGQYSYWAYEVLGFPNTVTAAGQNVTSADLKLFCRTLAGYDADLVTFNPTAKSIDADIAAQAGKTAIRLGDMKVSRQSVGGAINPN